MIKIKHLDYMLIFLLLLKIFLILESVFSFGLYLTFESSFTLILYVFLILSVFKVKHWAYYVLIAMNASSLLATLFNFNNTSYQNTNLMVSLLIMLTSIVVLVSLKPHEKSADLEKAKLNLLHPKSKHKKKKDKIHSVLLTFWVLIAIFIHGLLLLLYLILGIVIYEYSLILYFLALLSGVAIYFYIRLMEWKKKAFSGLLVVYALSVILNLTEVGSSMYVAINLFTPLILYLLIKPEWKYLK